MKKPNLQLKKIRHKLYATLSGGLVLSQIMMGVTYYSGPGITSETPETMAKNIINITNTERQGNNLPTVAESQSLNTAAKLKLDDMFMNNYWEHISPSGMQAWDFIKDVDYSYQYAGENLARGYHDSGSAMRAWMDSPTHKDNILNKNFSEIGVAIGSGKLNGKPVTLAVQLFAAPQTSVVANTQEPKTSILGAQERASLTLYSPVSSSRIIYFVAWFVLFLLIVFDGIELRRLGLHKNKKHMFEFRSALLINTFAFIILFITFTAVL